MPVTSRIDWCMQQVSMGRMCSVSTGAALDETKVKFKIRLEAASAGAISNAVAYGVNSVLIAIRAMAVQHVAVDRGHAHSEGVCIVSIWITLNSGGFVYNARQQAAANETLPSAALEQPGGTESPEDPTGSGPYTIRVDTQPTGRHVSFGGHTVHAYSDEHDDREALQEEESGDSDEVHGDEDDDVDDDPSAWDPDYGLGDDEEVVDDDDPSIWDPDYGCGDEEEVDSDDPGQWDSDYYDHLFEEAAGRGTSGTAEDQTAEAIDEDEYV